MKNCIILFCFLTSCITDDKNPSIELKEDSITQKNIIIKNCFDRVFLSEKKANLDTLTLQNEFKSSSANEIKVSYPENAEIVINNSSRLKTKLIYYQSKSNWDVENMNSWSYNSLPISNELIFKNGEGRKQIIMIRNDSIIKLKNTDCFSENPNSIYYRSFHFPGRDSIAQFKSVVGTLTIKKMENICADTDFTKIEIKASDGGEIIFNQTRNLFIAEFDADKDERKEVYLISHQSCSGRIEIIKIYK
tara:strand:- start:18288 stop:19031 length:744 start_codon:yes stop_codon:yes gene_type:complete